VVRQRVIATFGSDSFPHRSAPLRLLPIIYLNTLDFSKTGTIAPPYALTPHAASREKGEKGKRAMSEDTVTAGDRLKRELQLAVERIRVELDKIEILSAAMVAFSKPVPDYEPGFRHLRHVTASALELNSAH
jgi:hypothetical protein